MKLLTEVINSGLCCGCGTCAGICPTEAIKMNATDGLFVPEINEAKCNNCQLCMQACPGHSVDFKALRARIFGKEPESSLIGNYLDCYIGHSMDDLTRFDSTSGGIITQLLVFALENHLIDGAIVTRMRKNNPLETESFIARTAEEIIEASKSKYCPVTANVCLRQILKEDGRFAVVGLPCHIHGIRKAESVLRTLNKRIVLHLGLLCSHTVNFEGTYFLLKKLRIQKEEVTNITYRGSGWPGSMSIEKKNASKVSLPLVGDWQAYWSLFSSFFFTPTRCTVCPDQTAELSDISFGDAWLPELKSEKKGASILISRTSEGESLLRKAMSAGAISIKRVSVEKVMQSQFVNLKFKKNDLSYRLSLMSSFGKEIPTFNPTLQRSESFISALRDLYIYFNIKASSSNRFKSVLVNAPLPLIRLYYGIYKSLCLI